MRKATMIILILMGMLFFSLLAQSQESYYPYSYARLSYVQGEVRIERGNDLGVEAGEVNLVLASGDMVITEGGLAEISFGRNNFLRLDQDSVVEIVNLPQSERDYYSLHLYQGQVYLRINYLSEEKAFSLHTPDVSCYFLESGLYRIEVVESGRTSLMVKEGSVEVAGKDQAVILTAGESLSVAEGYFLETEEAILDDDDFSRWNLERDGWLEKVSYQSYRYLPEDMQEYEPELSAYGRWVYERPYGYVWVPAITSADWRPYLIGRWVWYPRLGWTWVSAEPWGWVVYHYGRWQWRLGLGWYWIPEVHWGPAWVHWYWDGEFIGWCPLSYWNRPLVIIDNYVYERYDGIYYPVHSRALILVKKNQLQAPHSIRILVRPDQIIGVERIRLQARQPQIRPVIQTELKSSASRLKVPAIGPHSSNLFSADKQKVAGNREIRPFASSLSRVSSYNRPDLSSLKSNQRKIPERGKENDRPSSLIYRGQIDPQGQGAGRNGANSRKPGERQKIGLDPEKPVMPLRRENDRGSKREGLTHFLAKESFNSLNPRHYRDETPNSQIRKSPSLSSHSTFPRQESNLLSRERNDNSSSRRLSSEKKTVGESLKVLVPARENSSGHNRKK